MRKRKSYLSSIEFGSLKVPIPPEFLEPPEPDLRPCEVDGQRCHFHRFSDEDKALLHVNVFIREDELRLMRKRFKEDGIVPPGCSTEVAHHTIALVELPDGTIKKVEPEAVRFLDRGEKESNT